jgi:aspartate aminotransferase-like enzyme
VTRASTFRIGCIGAVTKKDFEGLLAAIAAILEKTP